MDKSLEINKIKRHFLLKKSADSLMMWHFPKLHTGSEQLTAVVGNISSLEKANTTMVVDGSLLVAIYQAESDSKLRLTSLLSRRHPLR